MNIINEICFGNRDLASLGLNIELETKDYTVKLVGKYFSKKPNDVRPFDPPFCDDVIDTVIHPMGKLIEKKRSERLAKRVIITICQEIREKAKGLDVYQCGGTVQIRIAKAATEDALKKLSEKYLFSWDTIPGNDSERLLRYLRDEHYMDWAKNAEIHKSDDGKTISISKAENSAEIMIDERAEKVTLKIGDGKRLELTLKKENGTLNIHPYHLLLKFSVHLFNSGI